MLELNVDVAVIGAGTAGLAAYKSALKHTKNVVIIEGGKYGTTCARVGCMPSKLLIAAAESAHSLEIAHNFGVEINSGFKINGKKVMERVRNERDRFVGFVLDSVEAIPEVRKIRGYAKFLDDNTLQIDEHTTINAKSIVIATGSSTFIPPIFKDLGDKLIINDNVFDWEDLPESVAVFGAGIIGLEIGQALHRLGVKIKIFGRGGTVGHITDPEIKKYADKIFSSEFNLYSDSQVLSIIKENNKVKITYKEKDGSQVEDSFDYVLAATGRKPNLSKLGLENTSISKFNEDIPEFNKETMQIEDKNIFIAGDANNEIPLLHEASDQGHIAGTNASLFPNVEKGKRRAPIGIVFTDPQIATVGKSYKDLNGTDFVIGQVSFENQGRSRVILKNKGLMNVYAEKVTNKFLGSEMFGPQAEHLAHLLSWAYQNNMTIPQMLEMPFYHPVIEEGLRTALRDVMSKLN
jgi:dihydrolipoamide dehydrogenase